METNKINQIFNNINYNTYQNISRTLFLTSFCINITNDLLTSQQQVTSSENFLAGLQYTLLFTWMYLEFSNKKYQTKDFHEIKSLYQEFIKNYNTLNKTFDFNDVIQIHTMFNHMLYNGFLSKDKKFTFTDEDTKNINPILGTYITSGKGVCRHISATLTDILNDYGINAHKLVCNIRTPIINVKYLKEKKYNKEELFNWVEKHIYSSEQKILFYNLIEESFKNGIPFELTYNFEEDKSIIKNCFGNHAIVFAKKDDKSYFLDPTNFRIYRTNISNKNILYDTIDDKILIKNIGSRLLNTSKDFKKLNIELKKEMIFPSLEEEKELTESTLNICKENLDIFENFYNTNNELYNELSNKLQKIKIKH